MRSNSQLGTIVSIQAVDRKMIILPDLLDQAGL